MHSSEGSGIIVLHLEGKTQTPRHTRQLARPHHAAGGGSGAEHAPAGMLRAQLRSFTHKHTPFPHPCQIFHDRERKQDPTTKTPGFHLAFLIQSLVYAFLVREQSSDGFNGALNAVLGAFHQFFLKIASLISLNTLISLV